ncbi:hypothetical protein E2C01_085451 [Portunus trituberculatus]|uniref:Thioredoxin-like fold domain-containing protein n=1 Tax=Portunus trituberculatus TaxID=210409 RepID=A0A5B7J7N0_PORTR|nr:hypothetical protein [Portunus trituberculatus]
MSFPTLFSLSFTPFTPLSQLDHSEPLGASWLTPWVTMEDGEEVADSGIVIQELRRRHNLDLGSSLTAVEQAVARTFTVLVEEHLCW